MSDDNVSSLSNLSGRSGEKTRDERLREGRSLVNTLLENKVHPVLVFGTKDSGKSTMLQSMIHYARASEKAGLDIALGGDVFPPTVEAFQERRDAARDFFHSSVNDFNNGRLLRATTRENPFFIPVDINVRDQRSGMTNVRYAFLEGPGEWYEKKSEESSEFNEFKPEIQDIFRGFDSPLSVIFVAPCYSTEGRERLSYSHECLSNCIHEYRRLRRFMTNDNLLFVVTKWDAYTSNPVDSINLGAAPPDLVVDRIRQFPLAWVSFKELPVPAGKAMTPYSAGYIRDGEILSTGENGEIYDRFNRVMWNWLYGNAVSVETARGKRKRQILFTDVIPPDRRQVSWYDSLVDMVLGT